MRRALRVLLLIVLAPVLALALYLTAAFFGALWPGQVVQRAGEPSVRVGLAAGPIHYDFFLPMTPEVRDRFAFAEAGGVPVFHPDAEWLVAGWGAEGFYTATGTLADVALPVVWRAATGDRAVLRLDVAGALPPDAPIEWITLTPAAFAALAEGIAGQAGDPLPYPGFTDTDAFFAAPGRFHLLRTCNVWVGEQLRAAGIGYGAWTPTTWSVRLSLWWFGQLA